MSRRYTSPAAFKQALEQRLQNMAVDGFDFARRRQRLVFDRFLARVSALLGDAVILKGGLVLDLRLARARTTRDVDLTMRGDPAGLLEQLRRAGQLDLGDFLSFDVDADRRNPTIENEGMRYEGRRFRAVCLLAGIVYGDAFGIDVAFGDLMTGTPDIRTTSDVLDFAGVSPATVRVYPLSTHIAEKLHAYTMPRARPNTRVKDLPDIALLASAGEVSAGALRLAIQRTFDFRATHDVPLGFPDPPAVWAQPYARMAAVNRLEWPALEAVTAHARSFLDPVLRETGDARWDPRRWSWSPD